VPAIKLDNENIGGHLTPLQHHCYIMGLLWNSLSNNLCDTAVGSKQISTESENVSLCLTLQFISALAVLLRNRAIQTAFYLLTYYTRERPSIERNPTRTNADFDLMRRVRFRLGLGLGFRSSGISL